jgi:flagellar basal body-associated protein FliL
MLEKVAKIEEIINTILGKLIAIFWFVLHKILPHKVFSKTNELKLKTKQKVEKSKTSINEKKMNFFMKFLDSLSKLKSKIDKVRAIDFKSIIKEKLISIKNDLLITHPKKYITMIRIFIAPYIYTFKVWFKGIKKSQLYIATGSLTLVVLGGVGIYSSFLEIYNKEFPYREPASVQEYDYRPDYKSYEKKSLKVFNIKIPIHTENIGNVTSITVDFNIRISTRYARFYLTEYEYKLKDYFFTHLEMISSEFPLETEGKTILKNKIKEELNNFLKQEGVEGVIEEVNILFMIAT